MQRMKTSILLFGLGWTAILGGWPRVAVAQASGVAASVAAQVAALKAAPPFSFSFTPGVLLPPADDGVASTQAASTATPNTTGWIHVPGALVNPACVYTIPNGATIRLNGDVTMNGQVLFHEPPCPTPLVVTRPIAPQNAGRILSADSLNAKLPFLDGWVETWQTPATANDCAIASGPTQYVWVTTNFTVPADPINKSDGQLIFLFSAQEPASEDQILQPVLQWGETCPAGGVGCIGNWSSWTYAAWQVGPGNNVNHSIGITPAAGDVLGGGSAFYEYIDSGTVEEWIVAGSDESNTGLETQSITAEASSSELWACVNAAVLESEGQKLNQANCNDWPGGASGVNFWSYPTIYNQNGIQVQPTFSACVEPSTCIGTPEYSGTNCNFIADTYGSLYDLFF